ncbi:hypothetical protein ACFWOX_39090 [Streptomyces sp. NPDC058467]|uniref:hypothetical protein n=1 Tax=unclassified Streptomyces TaxID=2593676 RepID=UPI00364690FB
MRVHATAATAALLLAALTACGGGGDKADPKSPDKAVSAGKTKDKNVDCTDESLSQADWMAYCSDEAGTGGDGAAGKATGLTFGESHTWPDGLKVTVVDAKTWTTFTDADFATDDPKTTEFRVRLKLTNTGKQPVKLDELSTIIEGATNGGEADTTEFQTGLAPLEGRLAPGVTTVKTNDNSLDTKYGKKIIVTVQRSSDNLDLDFPEFSGDIAD